MNNILTVEKGISFIDSDMLSDLANKERRSITRLITNHKDALESFGVLRFEITKPDKQGGRPKLLYLLNEEQATLLTSFMTNNNKVVEFKQRLVKEFFRMRTYIQKQEVARITGIETRKTLTDVIQESGENERMHGKGYSNFTRLTYTLTNLIDKYNDRKNKDGFRDTLTPEELERVELAESLIRPLLKLNKQYTEIKESLVPLFKGV